MILLEVKGMLVVFSMKIMKWLTNVLRRIVCGMLIKYVLASSKMAPCNFA